jgi:hypothetical protein
VSNMDVGEGPHSDMLSSFFGSLRSKHLKWCDGKDYAADCADSNDYEGRCLPNPQKYKPHERETEIHRRVN